MFDYRSHRKGVSSRRRGAALSIATTALLMGSGANANEPVQTGAEAEALADPSAGPLTAAAEAGAAAGQNTIVITGERYRINTLNTRLPDVLDAPQSISIIPRDIIEKQAATTLNDVLRNVTGISMAAGEGGGGPGGDNLTLRGFGARNDIFVDGIRDFASYTRDTFNVEQVEVVKGPASAQTGRGSTGGYINLFSKQPKLATFAAGTAGVGLPEYVRGTADINVGGETLGIGAGTALRVNLLYHDADTPGRDYVGSQRFGIAPSIAVGLGTSTRAILSYFRLQQDNQPDYGIPFVPTTNVDLEEFHDQPAPVDYDNYYGLVERDYEDTVANIVTFALEHDISSQLRIANTTRYGHATRDSIYSAPRFAQIAPPASATGLLVNPQTQSRDTVDRILLNQSNLFAEFDTGGFAHDLVLGFEISEESSRNQLRSVTAGTPTDIFDPDPTRPWTGTIVDLPGEVVRAKADTVAAYLFDSIELSEQFIVTGGLRWERYKSRFTPAPSQLSPTVQPIGRTDNNLTWRGGLTYKPLPNLSFYAGAGTSVNPSIENMTQTTPNQSLAALKPERSRTFEIGAKWEGFDNRLLLTSAIFRTDKTNARTTEPGGTVFVLDGKQRVDGFELGATGRLSESWQLIGSYTYLDSEVRDSLVPADIGNRLTNVPKHSASLWTLYTLPMGVELGGGIRHVGARYTNLSNNRRVDGYWVADATLGYDFTPKTSLRLNVFNIFDERYADQIGGGHFVPGPGRSAVATLAFGL